MRKFALSVLISFICVLSGCNGEKKANIITFGVCADYPPFEYSEKGEINGFDVELARLLAQQLDKEAVIEDRPFSSLFAALQSDSIDAAISTITITEERLKNFDFSEGYYKEKLVMVYPTKQPIIDKSQLLHKKIACQLGTTMEMWLKKNAPETEIVTMDNNNQAIEALKAHHVDGVLIDSVQGSVFTQKNPGLSYGFIAESDNAYGIAFKKDSPLKDKINLALQSLTANGELERLKRKWLEGNLWKH